MDKEMWYRVVDWVQLAQRIVQCFIVTEFHNLTFSSTDILIPYLSVILLVRLFMNCFLCKTAYVF
jgi:hypothetical protein